METLTKRILSLFISAVMLLSGVTVPLPSYGEENENVPADTTQASVKQQQIIIAEDIDVTYGCKDFNISAVLAEGDGALSYASSDTGIATIDKTGRVHITGIGAVRITITASKTDSYLKTAQTITLTVKNDGKGPRIKLSKPTATSMKVSWNKNTTVTGYQIQYASNCLFMSRATKTVKNPKSTSITITGLSKGKTYYARVRSYTVSNGKTKYSPWGKSSNLKTTKNARLTVVRKSGKVFELRSQAKQKLYKYDTLQGSCTDGTYAYYALYNRNVEKCKIAKVKLSNMKVVKVSKALKIDHGNDLTYNSKKKYIVALHTTDHPKRISIIDRKTLKVKRVINVKIPSTISGATKAQAKAIYGFQGISYNAAKTAIWCF